MTHIIYIIFIALPSLIAYIIAIPMLFISTSHINIIYKDEILHEKYIQLRELEYMLDINDIYNVTYLSLICNYNRKWVYYSSYRLLQAMLLCLITIFLDQQRINNIHVLQIILFIIIFTIPPIILLIYAPLYRTSSSNKFQKILNWSFIITLFLVYYQLININQHF